MKLKIEVKDEEKITTYTADLEQAEQAVKEAVVKVGEFLKANFTKETFTKNNEEK